MGLREYGFWDYTTPCAGGMEAFQREVEKWVGRQFSLRGLDKIAQEIKTTFSSTD